MSVVVEASIAAETAVSDADRLFATLDGVRISNGRVEWSSHIQGIYADGPYVWVQLARAGEDAESVVLRLSRPTTAAAIIRALESVRFDEDSSAVVRL